jgi:hypothetical protein
MVLRREVKPITLTKKLKGLMKRYGVKLRESPSQVTHLTYQRTKEVDPVAFAVFETAIKANTLAWMLWHTDSPDDRLQIVANTRAIYANCSPPIAGHEHLPIITEEMENNSVKLVQQHSDVYHYCAKILVDAGLYYDLLD